jgi:hypothetical protein
MRRTALAVVLLLGMLPSTSYAQSGWDPLAGITQLVDWFSRLNDKFEQVVVAEDRGQLLRAVDRLRKELYALEADARILRDTVPDSVPTKEEREHLRNLAAELQKTVSRLTEASRRVGADLRLNEAEEVEKALTSGLRTRAAALTYLQRAINDSAHGQWNAPEVRLRLEKGIEAVRAAQLAVTSFRQKLSRSMST